MSDALPWLRLYTRMIDDEKIRLLAFEDRWHYVALLCCKRAGLLDHGDSAELMRRKLSVKLGLAPRELDAMADRLADVGLIDAETFQPVAWEKLQQRSDGDPTAAERKRRQRAREREQSIGHGVSRVTVTEVTRTELRDREEDQEQERIHPAREGTDAGRLCAELRKAGIIRTNPSHPDLLAALAAGIPAQTIFDTVLEGHAAGMREPFTWGIAAARGRHASGARPVPTEGADHANRPVRGESLVDRAARRLKTIHGNHPEAFDDAADQDAG